MTFILHLRLVTCHKTFVQILFQYCHEIKTFDLYKLNLEFSFDSRRKFHLFFFSLDWFSKVSISQWIFSSACKFPTWIDAFYFFLFNLDIVSSVSSSSLVLISIFRLKGHTDTKEFKRGHYRVARQNRVQIATSQGTSKEYTLRPKGNKREGEGENES